MLNAEINGFKFYKAMSNGTSNTVEMSIPDGICLVWAANRAKTTETMECGLALMSTTQGGLGFYDVAGDKFSGVTRDGSNMIFTFTKSAYWQVNALYVQSLG